MFLGGELPRVDDDLERPSLEYLTARNSTLDSGASVCGGCQRRIRFMTNFIQLSMRLPNEEC